MPSSLQSQKPKNICTCNLHLNAQQTRRKATIKDGINHVEKDVGQQITNVSQQHTIKLDQLFCDNAGTYLINPATILLKAVTAGLRNISLKVASPRAQLFFSTTSPRHR